MRHRGFALPFAVIMLVVILGLGAAYFTVSRQQLFTMSRHAASERAYHTASSALLVGQLVFDQARDFLNRSDEASWPKRSNAEPSIAGWVLAMLDSEGHLRRDGLEYELSHPLLDVLSAEPGSPQIDVTMRLRPAQPVFVGTALPISEAEVATVVEIEAKAIVAGVEVRLLAVRELRYIDITPSPLSRFTLMVRDFVETPILESPASLPVILNHGRTLACTPSLAPMDLATMLDTQGWVYLGSPAEIRLGANTGNDNISHRSPCLQEDMYLYSVDPADSFSSRDDLMYFSREAPLDQALRTMAEQEALEKRSADELKAGSLLVFGSVEAFSPTVILGPVRRVSALLQGLYNVENDKFSPLPELESSQFLGTDWPGGWTDGTRLAIVDNFGSDFTRYQIRASRLLLMDANFLSTRLLRTDADVFSLNPSHFLTWTGDFHLKNLSIAGNPAPWYQAAHATAYQLKDDSGSVYFDGGDFSKLETVPWLTEKSGYRFRSGRDFLRLQVVDGSLKLSGIVEIKGDLEITEPLFVPQGQGGIIVVEGNIRIRSAIQAQDSEPFTLLSKTGDIEVFTADPIEAGLVALNGVVNLPSAFDVSGFVSAREMRLNPQESGQVRKISFNPKMDPANSLVRRKNFRMMTEGGWQLAIQ